MKFIQHVKGGDRDDRVGAPLVEVDIGFLAHQVGVPTTDTFDLSQGVHNLALAVHIRVQQTQDMLQDSSLSLCNAYYNDAAQADLKLHMGFRYDERHLDGLAGD